MEEKNTVVEGDEAVLDKELEETLSTIKNNAGNVPPASATAKTEDTPSTEPTGDAPKADEAKADEYEFRIPNKGKLESDEAYEKRVELLDLVKRRKLAKSPEQRQELTEQINTTKGQLKAIGSGEKIISQNNSAETPEKPKEEDPDVKADRERLKQLGGATRDDVLEILKEERTFADTKNTLDTFISRHQEFKDADVREVFFDFVDSNFNWQGKNGKDLMTVLELARESMFKPSESIQERVLKGANVQEKVNAMQFPGGTIAKQDYSPEMRNSINELVATGMSEAKAIELLSE